MVYLVVPERHKDGAYHFHGLFGGLNDSEKWNAKKREFATISKIMEKESYSEEYRSGARI